MSGPVATVVAQSRVPGADGAYTDQMVVVVEGLTINGWFLIPHDLKRIPDWARATKLTYGDADTLAPSVSPLAKLEPALNVPLTLLSKRLAWDAGDPDSVTSGRPPVMPPNHDLTTDLWFGAAGDFILPPDPPEAGPTAYYLIEVGITHSVSK